MLTVTEDAKTHLNTLIEQNNIAVDQTLRLVPRPEGLGLAPDQEKPSDTTFELEGRTVLAVDERVAEQLGNCTLGINQTAGGPQLSLSEGEK